MLATGESKEANEKKRFKENVHSSFSEFFAFKPDFVRFAMLKTHKSDSMKRLFDRFNITYTNNFTVICNEKFNSSENITVTFFTPDLSCRNSDMYTVK